jgi:hypothetical protein
MQLSYCCTATCSRTNTAAAVAARIFQDNSATKYTSISDAPVSANFSGGWLQATGSKWPTLETPVILL